MQDQKTKQACPFAGKQQQAVDTGKDIPVAWGNMNRLPFVPADNSMHD